MASQKQKHLKHIKTELELLDDLLTGQEKLLPELWLLQRPGNYFQDREVEESEEDNIAIVTGDKDLKNEGE